MWDMCVYALEEVWEVSYIFHFLGSILNWSLISWAYWREKTNLSWWIIWFCDCQTSLDFGWYLDLGGTDTGSSVTVTPHPHQQASDFTVELPIMSRALRGHNWNTKISMILLIILLLNNYKFTGSCKEQYWDGPCPLYKTFLTANIRRKWDTVSFPGNWHCYNPEIHHLYLIIYICNSLYVSVCL